MFVFIACVSSEELGLDDIMDIELDFPTLSDSQNASASPATCSFELEVSLIGCNCRNDTLHIYIS